MTTRLKDYQPVPFKVATINLNFVLHPDEVVVTNRLAITPLAGAKTLVLDGSAELLRVTLDDEELDPALYQVKKEHLYLRQLPSREFTLEIVTKLYPKTNKTFMGLYASKGNLFTQCEAEGFRKITYFFDRPDVMTEYFVTIDADKKEFPVLLSNGNKIAAGDEGERHWVKWHDPFPKPSYLFALVAGKLAHKKTEFITRSGRKIAVYCYSEARDLDQIDFALASITRAMKWDEERFGLEYDLDTFMVVAVGDFNMGAMENKGLNIFNTKYVLAHPDTATDQDFVNVEDVIGHEYFHNYTGDRVTCRDWFQLTLKEGLTVFRDQEFSADMASRATRRIKAVQVLRELQFDEDAGPLAHPIRPTEYEEINNFYTTTVYEKGAEVVRMLHTILGEEGFLGGLRLYLSRHDGKAVTCEDFVGAMADANHRDLTSFFRWYLYAGTPTVKVKSAFDAKTRRLSLRLKQSRAKKSCLPLVIPLKTGLVSKTGEALSFRREGEKEFVTEAVLLLEDFTQTIVLEVAGDAAPIVSIGRGFSAPIKLLYKQSNQELCTLLTHDKDALNRWDAGQKLYKKVLRKIIEAKLKGKKKEGSSGLKALTRELNTLLAKETDDALLALLLTLPGFNEFVDDFAPVDPVKLQKIILGVQEKIAEACLSAMAARLRDLSAKEKEYPEAANYHPDLAGGRALMNVLRAYLVLGDKRYFTELTDSYEDLATNMTHRLGVLTAINSVESPVRARLLTEFAEGFKEEALVLDKYFALIASSLAPDTLTAVKAALASPYFNLTNPNKVRALLATFCRNPLFFHQADGAGYVLIADLIVEIEKFNPHVAAGLVTYFKIASKLDKSRQKKMKKVLTRILRVATSIDVRELAKKIADSI